MISSDFTQLQNAHVASGQSLRAFLHKQGIPESTYHAWRRRFKAPMPRPTNKQAHGFIEATLSDSSAPLQVSTSPTSPHASIEFFYRGVTLICNPNTPAPTIVNCLKAIHETFPC